MAGDEGAGKSSLIARLQGRKHANEEFAQGTGLEYSYMDVKDEDSGEGEFFFLPLWFPPARLACSTLERRTKAWASFMCLR